jgi:hypothetical protein
VCGYGGLAGAKYTVPRIHLTKEEEKLTRDIQKQGQYILVHPFASQPGKQRLKTEYYPTLIDTLIDDLGYNVVAVGATYDRHLGWGSIEKKEELDYERLGLFNLVNKSGVRAAVSLARGAYGFMGSWSAFHRACALCPAGPLIFCAPDRASTIDRVNKRREPGSKYRKILVPDRVDIEVIKRKITGHLRRK